MTRAYAIKLNGQVNARTVFETESGAVVNGLAIFFNYTCRDSQTDEEVMDVWREALERLAEVRPDDKLQVVRVDIVEAHDA